MRGIRDARNRNNRTNHLRIKLHRMRRQCPTFKWQSLPSENLFALNISRICLCAASSASPNQSQLPNHCIARTHNTHVQFISTSICPICCVEGTQHQYRVCVCVTSFNRCHFVTVPRIHLSSGHICLGFFSNYLFGPGGNGLMTATAACCGVNTAAAKPEMKHKLQNTAMKNCLWQKYGVDRSERHCLIVSPTTHTSHH